MQAPSGRRTKIVATIGPSSDSPELLRQLIRAGMNVARLNFSHGSHAEHQTRYEAIRLAAEEIGESIGIMMDLQGPKIRTGPLVNGEPVLLMDGDSVRMTTRACEGGEGLISTTYEDLPRDLRPGDSIYLADGLLELAVDRVEGTEVDCTVIHGGMLGEHKGINLPGVEVSAPSLMDKDLVDLSFGLKLGVDFVALSFVRTADDVLDLRRRIAQAGVSPAIVSKIERPEALKNFDAILEATDVVMLARGDLGVEVSLEDLPQIQKELIGKCNDAGVPVITATQMLESMTSHPRPTRAEVADVANAVYDGTDALMLSGETASGSFPVRAVKVMCEIAENADTALAKAPSHDRIVRMRESGIREGRGNFGDSICQSVCRIANAVNAKRIVCFTKTGATAALIARYRPSVPITALALEETVQHRCAVIWGVDSARTIELCSTDELDAVVDDVLLSNGFAEPGDTVIVAGSAPLGVRTRTNMLKIHRVQQSAQAGGPSEPASS